ncbi:hypothetical protein KEJ51_06510 [Candidatus Bathyarchaeota archaeon]|nr:hypothetical protein [Candidatus Bathyarchaeota archaeon]
MSNFDDRNRILDLIRRLDMAYTRGFLSPEEYGVLRRGLEVRLPPVRKSTVAYRPTRAVKARRGFKFKIAAVAVFIVAVLAAASVLYLMVFRAGPIPAIPLISKGPEFAVSGLKFEQGLLSMTIKNTGTADAHDLKVFVRHSKGEMLFLEAGLLKIQDSVSVSKTVQVDTSTGTVRLNIVVTCKEGTTRTFTYP